MDGMNFEAMAQKETIKDLQRLEEDFDKIPEVGFKMAYKKKEENFAEKLVEDLK
jgi:hypothetical protein